MKKLRFVLFSLLIAFTAQGSHLMGGQMTSRNIGGLTYETTLTAYRDTLGIPMYTTANFNYSDGAGWTVLRTVPVSSPFVFGNGVEEYTYIDTITFPSAGNYSVWFEDCCRNAAILNMTSPGSESFHLYTNLWADSTNSTPVFLNPPITLAQLGFPFTYNPLPYDVDGDSIAWVLDTPVSTGGAFVTGYTTPPSDTSMPFTMDPVTGVISFLPNTMGNFVVSVLVKEYRNGIQIGEIRRDVQIIVIQSLNLRCLVNTTANIFPNTGYQYNLSAGVPFSLTVTATDPDNQPLIFRGNGEPFVLSNNVATVSVVNGIGHSTGTITWTPNVSQSRARPYIFAIRLVEPFGGYVFNSDITFKLNVNMVNGIIPVEQVLISNVFPNPSHGSFSLELLAPNNGKADLVITNLLGEQVYSLKNILVNEGVNAIVVNDAFLNTGMYTISVVKEGNVIAVQNFDVSY